MILTLIGLYLVGYLSYLGLKKTLNGEISQKDLYWAIAVGAAVQWGGAYLIILFTP